MSGALAEVAAMLADSVYKLPSDAFDPAVAAGFELNYGTTWHGLKVPSVPSVPSVSPGTRIDHCLRSVPSVRSVSPGTRVDHCPPSARPCCGCGPLLPSLNPCAHVCKFRAWLLNHPHARKAITMQSRGFLFLGFFLEDDGSPFRWTQWQNGSTATRPHLASANLANPLFLVPERRGKGKRDLNLIRARPRKSVTQLVGPGAQGEGSTAYCMGGNSLAYSYNMTTHAVDPNR